MYTVRFNLGRGERYMKWKVTYPDGDIKYLDPDKVSLLMRSCQLYNRPETAEKIFKGANKSVCAWVKCRELVVKERVEKIGSPIKVCYNPRIAPYWTIGEENVDNKFYPGLITYDKGVYIG